MKTEAYKLYSRVFWIFLPNVIEIDPCNFELYRFKVSAFIETQCTIKLGRWMGYIPCARRQSLRASLNPWHRLRSCWVCEHSRNWRSSNRHTPLWSSNELWPMPACCGAGAATCSAGSPPPPSEPVIAAPIVWPWTQPRTTPINTQVDHWSLISCLFFLVMCGLLNWASNSSPFQHIWNVDS